VRTNAFRFASFGQLVALALCLSTPFFATLAQEEEAAIITDGSLGQLDKDSSNFSQALAFYVSGLIHRAHEDKDLALDDFEKVIQLDPTREELGEMIAQEYFRANNYKKAAEVLELSLKQNSESVLFWSLLSIAYRADEQWDKSTEAAERTLKLDPTRFTAYEVLYEIALEQKKPDRARKVLNRAAKQKTEDYQYWLKLADLHTTLSSKEPTVGLSKEEIAKFYEKAVHLQPDDPAVLARVADFHTLHQNIPQAIELYKKILEKQPHAENIRLKLALSYVAKEDGKQAVQILEEIVQHEPFRFQVFTLIGELYEELKDHDHALANYRLSLSANPNQLVPHLKIALLEIKNKNSTEAIKQLEEAQSKFPATPQIPYFFGLAYSDAKNHTKAVESFEECARLAQSSNPEMLDSVFYFYYGAALERSGNFDQAVTQFKKVIDLNPDYVDAYNYLGFMYADKNIKLDEALQLIEKALAYEPENGAFLDSLGWVYYHQGKLDKALAYLKSSAKLIGNDPVVFDHLADVYQKMGKHLEAAEYYEKALGLDPDNKELKTKLENVRKDISHNPVTNSSHNSSPTTPASEKAPSKSDNP
jgi:tetratricopeptide (TPR) repeat protein